MTQPAKTDEKVQFRREFLAGAAAVLGAAALNGQTGSGTMTPSPANDINLLNYALTLEHLEATFYNQGLSRFSSADFQRADFYAALQRGSGINSGEVPLSGSTGTGLVQDVYAYLTLVRNHEQQHVRTLESVIRSLGGTPAAAPRFNLNFTSVDEFIATAAALENTGVSAYNGAIPLMFSADLITASATIATVEARHAAYLNRLRGMNPFPDAFDMGKTMAEVLQIAAPFIAQ